MNLYLSESSGDAHFESVELVVREVHEGEVPGEHMTSHLQRVHDLTLHHHVHYSDSNLQVNHV